MIKITKSLNREDGGSISSGSLIEYTTRQLDEEKTIVYDITLFFSQSAKDAGKLPIPNLSSFKPRLIKECNAEEWLSLNGAGSQNKIQNWLKEIIDLEIGQGFTEII